MYLRDFVAKYNIDPVRLALECGVCPASIYAYLAGRRVPYQKTAEKIEAVCDGLVTVLELRGRDDRIKNSINHTRSS